MKKVLIITYYWPPAGGPGVQRVLKFAKYLPEFGWQPIILTVKNGEYPAIDETLVEEIPECCKIYKTNSIEPNFLYKKFTGMGSDEAIPIAALTEKKTSWKMKLAHWIRLNLFIPDAKIGWIHFAVKEGKRIIKKEKPDLIFSSSPPPTVHLIARKLTKWSKLKWVADFRDPWTKIHYYTSNNNFISRKIDERLEKKVISSCTAATCASNSFIYLLTSKHKNKFSTITNGYDFKIEEGKKERNLKLKIVYTGGLTSNRFYEKFFLDVAEAVHNKPELSELFGIILVGKVEKNIEEHICKITSNSDLIKFAGYVKHQKAIEYMKNADVLLLFMEKKENYEGHIPAKVFEYLTTGNYILGIGSVSGDTARILEKTNAGKVFSSTEDFSVILENLISDFKQSTARSINWDEIKKYSRKELTRKLAWRFDSI